MPDVLIGEDTFNNTGGSNVNLEDWTPTGTSPLTGWAKANWDTDTAVVRNDDQTVYATADANYVITDTVASAEQFAQITTTYSALATNKGVGPMLRVSASVNTKYWLRPSPSNNRTELYRTFAGTTTLLDSFSQTFATSTPYTYRLEASTNGDGNVEITCLLGGVAQTWTGAASTTYVDSSGSKITAAGSIGLSLQSYTNVRSDDFSCGLLQTPTSISVDEYNGTGPYVFQRGAGGSYSVPVSGAYAGGEPASVEVRIEDFTSGAALSGLDWSAAGITSGAGTWDGARSVPGYDGWLRVKARWSDDTGVVGETSQVWAVGDRYLFWGQSNAFRHFDPANGTGYAAHANTAQWEDTAAPSHVNPGWLTPPAANGVRALTATLRARAGVTVAAMGFGESSEALLAAYDNGNGYWLDLTAGAAYDDMVQGIAAIEAQGGTGWAGLIGNQGETDAGQGLATSDEYLAGMVTFFGRVRTLLGDPTLPIYIQQTGRDARAGKDNAAFNRLRTAQAQAAATISNCHIAAVAYPIALAADNVHYSTSSTDGYALIGERTGEFIAYTQGESGAIAPGPKITGFQPVTSTTTRVKLLHGAGTDITTPSGTAWIRVTDDGTPVTVSSIAREDASNLIVTHDAISGTRALQFGYGATFSLTGIPVDNSASALPLWPAGEISQVQSGLLKYAAAYYHG